MTPPSPPPLIGGQFFYSPPLTLCWRQMILPPFSLKPYDPQKIPHPTSHIPHPTSPYPPLQEIIMTGAFLKGNFGKRKQTMLLKSPIY